MIFYIYIGYPLLVFLVGLFINRDINRGAFEPYVTILIAAYNEEKSIETTLKNKLELDYPKEKLEIIVISDGSTDNTDRIARRFEISGVQFIRQEPRKGKTAALNLAVPRAKGEILIFSDANSIYDANALRMLVQNFSDPQVGYVTGRMIYIDTNGTAIGDGCTIQEESVIEKSIIWRNTRLEPRARVKKSIIADNCYLHSGCLCEESVLGDNVTVTRDCHLPPGSSIEPGTTV